MYLLSSEWLWPLYLWYEKYFISSAPSTTLSWGQVMSIFKLLLILLITFEVYKKRSEYNYSLVLTIFIFTIFQFASTFIGFVFSEILLVLGKDNSSWNYYAWLWLDCFCLLSILIAHTLTATTLNWRSGCIMALLLVNGFWYITLQSLNVSNTYWVEVTGYPGGYRPNALAVFYLFYYWAETLLTLVLLGGVKLLQEKINLLRGK